MLYKASALHATRLCACMIMLFLVGCSQVDVKNDANLCDLDGPARSAIFERVSEGSEQALRKTVTSLSCLDGGDLEDAHIAMGVGLFRFPAQFASRLGWPIGQDDLQAISIMLPATFVDEPCKTADELFRRLKVADKMTTPPDVKRVMVKALEESLRSETSRCHSGLSK